MSLACPSVSRLWRHSLKKSDVHKHRIFPLPFSGRRYPYGDHVTNTVRALSLLYSLAIDR